MVFGVIALNMFFVAEETMLTSLSEYFSSNSFEWLHGSSLHSALVNGDF